MYIETSRPRKEGDQARLVSPFFDVAPKNPYSISNPPAYCFGFFYHMYGKHIGKFQTPMCSGSFQSSVVSQHIITSVENQFFDNPYWRRILSSLCILLKMNQKTGRISFYRTTFHHVTPVGHRSAFETQNQDLIF